MLVYQKGHVFIGCEVGVAVEAFNRCIPARMPTPTLASQLSGYVILCIMKIH